MKRLIICLFLTSCSQPFFGVSVGQRFRLYEGAAVIVGHPELVPLIDAVKPVTSAKNPVKVIP